MAIGKKLLNSNARGDCIDRDIVFGSVEYNANEIREIRGQNGEIKPGEKKMAIFTKAGAHKFEHTNIQAALQP